MLSIANPGIDADLVFDQCISKVTSREKLLRLKSIRPIIKSDSERYRNLAASHELHRLPPREKVGEMNPDEVIRIYTNQMAKKGASGRDLYDKILANANGICPICAHGRPDSLDHYLPKTRFSSLCITPDNLVPCCSYCNKAKGDDFPRYAVSQTLHPYFDNLNDVEWLSADVCLTSPLTFRYYVDSSVAVAPVTLNRIYKHFNDFSLKYLYETQAASEMTMIYYQIIQRYNDGGAEEVARHLRECFESYYKVNLNHWKTAMYKGLDRNQEWLKIIV